MARTFRSVRTRATLRTIRMVSLRTLYTCIAALAVCVYAPLIALFVSVAGHFLFGMSQESGYAAIDQACAFSRATIDLGVFCGSGK